MRIHTSNFKLMGFVHETPLVELAAVGRERGIATLDDLGSGTLLATAPYGLAPEPTVQESMAAGADLVTAIGAYEGDMREVAYPFHRMTLEHDKNFGGGALQKAG